MTETKIGQKNMNKQQEFIEQLGEKNCFSPKGIKYLANRALGTKYRPILEVAITAMQNGTLQKIIPENTKTKIRDAFNYKDEIPDAALVIIGTGRRAVKGAKGWDEGGVSLLNVPELPNNIEELPLKDQERIVNTYEHRDSQREASQELMDCLLKHQPVKEVFEPESTPPKTADVVQFKKKSIKPIPEVIVPEEVKAEEPTPVVKKTPIKRIRKSTKKEITHD